NIRGSGAETVATWFSGIIEPWTSTTTGSSSAVLARPVRRPERSLFRLSTAPPMRRSTSALSYLGISAFLPHYGLHAFAGQHSREVALLANGKNHDRYVVVAAQGHGRGVHHLQVVRKHPVVTYGFETLGVRILLGVVVIDSVDAGAFEQRITLHLGGA